MERRRLAVLLAIALAALLGAGVAWRLGSLSGEAPAVASSPPPSPPSSPGAPTSPSAPALALARGRAPASPPLLDPSGAVDAAAEELAPGLARDRPARQKAAVTLYGRFIDARGAPVPVRHWVSSLTSEAPEGPSRFRRDRGETLRSTWMLELDEELVGRARLSIEGTASQDEAGVWRPPGLAWSTEVVTIALAPGENGPVDLRLLSPSPLTVRVRDTAGRPLDGIVLTLRPFDGADGRSSGARTGPSGVVELAAHETLVGTATLGVWDPRTDRLDERALVLGSAPSTIEVVLPEAPPPGTLHVQIVDAQGRPAAYKGHMQVHHARIAADLLDPAKRTSIRAVDARDAPDPTAPREERFILPASSYLVSIEIGAGEALQGPFVVETGATTSADVTLLEPGALVVRLPPLTTPGAAEDGVEANMFFLDMGSKSGWSIPWGEERRFEGVGPVELQVRSRHVLTFITRAVLSPGAVTVIDVPPLAFGALHVRVVDGNGKPVTRGHSLDWTKLEPGSARSEVQCTVGAPAHDVVRDEEVEGAVGSPGVVDLVRVPPGPCAVAVEGISVEALVRPGETTDVTVVLPIDVETYERIIIEARRAAEAERRARSVPVPEQDAELDPEDPDTWGWIEALVVDDAGRPHRRAEVLYRREEAAGWGAFDSSGLTGSASKSVPPGTYLLRARADDRLEGPIARVVLPPGQDASVRLSTGPREEAAKVAGQARGRGYPGPLWVVVSDAGASGAGAESREAYAERSADVDVAGRFEIGGLPAGIPLRVTLCPSRKGPGAEPGERARRATPGSFAILTLAPGERRQVDLALPEAALVTAGRVAAEGRLTALDAATLEAIEGASPTPEGQTLALAPGKYAIGLARDTPGASLVLGIRVIALAPGERLAWPAAAGAHGEVTVRGLYRAAPDTHPEARRALLAGPGVAIGLSDGRLFSHDRLPAGRYALCIGGREVRAWDAAPGQVLDLGVLEGR